MNNVVSVQELQQAQFVAMRVIRVEHALIKFSYGDNTYANALSGKHFKASNNVAIAMKGMNDPIGIRQITQSGLALQRMPAAFKPGFVDVTYQFIRVVSSLPSTRSSP